MSSLTDSGTVPQSPNECSAETGHFVKWQFNRKRQIPWRKHPRTADEVQAWRGNDPNRGTAVIPESVGCWVLDVDLELPEGVAKEDATEAEKEAARPKAQALAEKLAAHTAPIVSYRTKSGGYHLWYRGAGPGRQTGLQSMFGGRCDAISSGLAVIYDYPRWAEAMAEGLASAPVVDPVTLLRLKQKPKANGKARGNGQHYQPGGRNNTLFKRACKAFRLGGEGGEAAAAAEVESAVAVGLPREEAEATLESARKAVGLGAKGETPTAAKEADLSAKRERVQLKDMPSGNNSYTLEEVFRREGIRIRFNLRRGAVELSKEGGPFERLEDVDSDELRERVRAKYCYYTKSNPFRELHIGAGSWQTYCNAIAGRGGKTDPFLDEYLHGLPAWDKTPRLDNFISGLFAVADGYEDLARWAGRYLFMGAVARALRPGMKLDESPVFIGPKRSGKSTMLRRILPPGEEGDGWFSDSLELGAFPKERIEALSGKVIVEIAEMAGARKLRDGQWKAFLSRQGDEIRLAWHRHPSAWKRRCIFAGTADHLECLPNDPNLGRFVVVRIRPKKGRKDHFATLRRAIDEARDQLWAEALCRVKQGEIVRLPEELKPAAEEAAENSRSRDASVADAYAAKAEVLTGEARKAERGGMSLSEISASLEIEKDGQYNAGELRTTLSASGWVYDSRLVRRKAGGRARLWYPPKEK